LTDTGGFGGAPGPVQVGALNQQLLRMAELLQLIARARDASRAELPFVLVNETVRLVPYDQAVLWDARSGRIVALSGSSRVESGAPYVLMLSRLHRQVSAIGKGEAIHTIDPEVRRQVQGGEAPMLAPQLLWWPLRVRGRVVAVLMLGRRTPWLEAELPLLDSICGSYAQAWELSRARLAPGRPGRLRRVRNLAMSVAACLVLALGFVPVRSSVIAPAEVVAREPAFVRAPFAGIVDSIEVAPNAAVRAGRVLVRLERRQLAAEYSVAGKALEVATAQLRQTSQEAIADAKVRELLAGVRGRFDEARADFEYRKARLARADIAAPVDGVAVFNDPAEWIGRPVEIGERIMQVAPASSSRIEIELPASEMADFANDAEVSFFSNLKPNEPNAGHLIFMSYAATAMPSGVLAYIARADLEPGSKLRLGLKGSAKIFGRRQPLILWLLRRPLAYVHQLLA
jgi:hypothetical protein